MDILSQNRIQCPKCYGEGISKGHRRIELLEVCPKCLGDGYIDWVANVVNSRYRQPVNKNSAVKVAHQNIYQLRTNMMDLAMEVGYRITIDIKKLDYGNDLMRTGPPSIIEIGGY